MFLGMGCPFAQLDREIAPCISEVAGNCTGRDGRASSGSLEADQIGLGNEEVTFFVPQPIKVSTLANKNSRLATCFLVGSNWVSSVCWFCIKVMNMSVSSN